MRNKSFLETEIALLEKTVSYYQNKLKKLKQECRKSTCSL